MPSSLYVRTHLRACRGPVICAINQWQMAATAVSICPIWVVNCITVLTLLRTLPGICNEYSKALSTVSIVGKRPHCSSAGIFNYCHLTICEQKVTGRTTMLTTLSDKGQGGLREDSAINGQSNSLPSAPEDGYEFSKPYGYLHPKIPLRC